MSRSIFRVVRIVALCTFAVASSARAQDTTPVEKLREEGKLDEKKNHPADSGEDAAKGYTRQGFGHIRQGNTSSDKDPFGRAFAPYGGESYETLAKKFEDRLNTPDWTLGIDMQEPRRIVVEYPDGTAQEYWYILFRLINDNYRKVSTKVVSDYDPSKAGTGEINAVNIENQEAERWEGIPVRANIDVVVETLRYNTHAEPVRHGDEKRDDLHAELTKEAEKDTGKGLSGNADTAEAERLVKERYQHARKTYTDISDAWVLQRIAEQEQLWEWRDGKREYILWPASAFKAEIAPAYEYESDWLDGPRCLPHQVEKFDEKGNLYIVTRYPGVYEDNSWAGYFGEQDTLPAGVRLVKGPDDASGMYGKLTKRRYKNYDVVDRFGRVLGENEPGYLAAKAAGGRIVKNNPDIGDKGNLDALIGQTARRPAHRRYKAGDHVLMEWDTGVAMPGRPNQNYIINGMIIQPGDNGIHKGYDKIRREYTGLNPKADEEVGTVAVRASQEDRYQTAKVLSEDDELFRRRPVSEHIPVKVLDYLGRPVTRGAPVTYQIGDTVTELEYRIWAERYPAELVKRFEKTSAEKYGSEPWKRTLQFHDFLVGLPKIKMGRGEDISVTTPETLKRGIAKKIENGQVVEMDVVDYVTGRPYDPKMIKPDVFMRDPDGTFTTFRTPPVPPNAALAEGEAYVYAPLGPADVGAMPVPRFDRFGVWEDYVHPVSGKRIPLVDGKGELVRDQYDQIQYVKDYEYEYLYLYDFEPAEAADESYRGSYGGDLSSLKTVSVPVITKGGNITGLALPRIVRKEKYTDPLTGKEETRRTVVGLAFGNKRPAGELEELEEASAFLAPGEAIENVEMDEFIFNYLIATYVPGGSGEKAIKPSDFQSAKPENNKLEEVIRTYDRWTLPPPFVYMEKNPTTQAIEPRVQTRIEVPIGPDGRTGFVEYISERWGAFVFTGIDRGWDYMNVYVRGLRPGVARKGRTSETYTLPSATTSGTVEKTRSNTNYYRQDWVYGARYERLGDEYENFRDLIRPLREYWFLRSEELLPVPSGVIPGG